MWNGYGMNDMYGDMPRNAEMKKKKMKMNVAVKMMNDFREFGD